MKKIKLIHKIYYMESEANRVTVFRTELDSYQEEGYDFEIKLSLCQKILIFFLNLMTGGFEQF